MTSCWRPPCFFQLSAKESLSKYLIQEGKHSWGWSSFRSVMFSRYFKDERYIQMMYKVLLFAIVPFLKVSYDIDPNEVVSSSRNLLTY